MERWCPAERSAKADLLGALQNIFTHPNVGPFISRQLIQHLVVSNPSLDYVTRVATVFADNGSGVRGDIWVSFGQYCSILRRVSVMMPQPPRMMAVTSESRSFSSLACCGRWIGSVMTTNSLAAYASAMGQNLYYPASVFSYFSPNYHLIGSQLLVPEFQTYSTATSLTRANFINALVFGNIDATTHIDLSPYISAASNAGDLLTAVNKGFLYGRMPAEMQQSILTALGSAQTDRQKAQTAVYLVASSPLYQVAH